MLFFLIGLFFICWNQYGLCTNSVKEDSNPKYGTDFDAEVGCVIVFNRSHPGSATNMIHDLTNCWLQARDTDPEYESVDASQGTRASDKHSREHTWGQLRAPSDLMKTLEDKSFIWFELTRDFMLFITYMYIAGINQLFDNVMNQSWVESK